MIAKIPGSIYALGEICFRLIAHSGICFKKHIIKVELVESLLQKHKWKSLRQFLSVESNNRNADRNLWKFVTFLTSSNALVNQTQAFVRASIQ